MLRDDQDPVSFSQCTDMSHTEWRRLHRYEEELKVRDARARGREEGRAEVRVLLTLD